MNDDGFSSADVEPPAERVCIAVEDWGSREDAEEWQEAHEVPTSESKYPTKGKLNIVATIENSGHRSHCQVADPGEPSGSWKRRDQETCCIQFVSQTCALTRMLIGWRLKETTLLVGEHDDVV
ncbi:hypothetical protein R1flu_020687 [Riccia fluitans]|uniref:Uncharacterized protein n=1 Tax=Riccia fluitans TaxID=41844 RepID=A0ABD1ZM81_9MARC